MNKINTKIYKSLKEQKKISTESLVFYLDLVVEKDTNWDFDYNLILKYGLMPEIIYFYYSHPQVQNEYADMLIEHITKVSNMMKKYDKERYKMEYQNDEIASDGSVITVNKILNRIPVKQDEVMSAFINISKNSIIRKYVKDKFKNIDVYKLLETVYNKFGSKDSDSTKQTHTR